MIRLTSNSKTVVAVNVLLLLCLSVPAFAAKKKKRAKKTGLSEIVSFDARLDVTYDDNVINYSDDDLDLYEGDPQDSKFAIDSKDDFAFIPSISARVKGNFIKGHTAWLEPSFRYYYYARNDIRRYARLGVIGRHYVGPGTYGEVEYAFLPDYYYRNQYYVDESGSGSYIEANFSKHYLKFEIGKDLTSTFKADISYRYRNKTFNEEFSERDLTTNGIRVDGIWRATRSFKFWGYYGLEGAKAKGADIEDLNVRDVSYDAWDVTVGVRHYSSILGRLRPEFVSTFKYRQIKYQTTKYLDDYRFGRKDNNYYIRIGVAGRLPGRVRLEIDYNFVAKRTSLLELSVEDLLDYDSNSVTFGLGREF
jgi:hypothetical protein